MDNFNNEEEYLELIKKYKLTTENTVECIWLFDLASNCFKYISPSIFNLRGLTVEESLKEKPEDCLTPESLKKLKSHCINMLYQFLDGARSENILPNVDVYDQYCKDGTIKKVKITTNLIFNKSENNLSILGITRDISYMENPNNKVDYKLQTPFSNVHSLLKIYKARIYCFGKLLVYGNNSNSPVKWRTKKSEELFAYLLQNREQEISKWEICDTLWPECSPDKVNNRLHTTLYKMKQTLNSCNINFDIKFINGCYWFSIIDVYIDTVEFHSILSCDINITENTIKKYKKAFLLYKNPYLEGNDFAWLFYQRELYSIEYHKLAKKLIDYYMKTNNYSDAKRIIFNILKIYPLDEYTNKMCLKLYFNMNDRASFIKQYKTVERLYKTELGIKLSSATKELYDTILNS
ncbi:PAS domain S-box protein [Clostridium sp. P21]|uniref:PAS domain S-box protein n=1 Tax=Clostridium muellerianum TaxID=2716538 RepID=A0A7Y0EGB5_9CLOT|nr:BTAD domain-containing putative transcriptional regulator [Clostridium muellerianum]NMM62607.1 PAS domain S-box protein [Clostridium muellerianum]